MSPEQAAENRSLLTKLAKRANQRLVRLERAKAADKKNFLATALSYAHRALARVGRKRFEEHNKGMTDKQVSAALRRVSRFLNMPESTVEGQRASLEAFRKYQDFREAKGAKAGPGVLSGRKPAAPLITEMERRRDPDQDEINFERYKQLTYRAMQSGISKTFSYQTIRQSIETGVKAGFSDDQIMNRVSEMAEDDELTRDQLLQAFGDEAREAAEEEEAREIFSREELEKWRRRKKTEEVKKKKRSRPPRRK